MPNTAAIPIAERQRNVSISYMRANVEGLIFASVVLSGMVIGYELLWSPADYPMDALLDAHWVAFLGGLIGSIAAHELLHGVGFRMFGKVPWREIRFGVRWRVLIAYAHTPVAMRARGYRWSAALPGIVLGLVPAAAGMLLAIPELAMYGALMLAGAGGDATVLRMIRYLPPDALVQDHSVRCGCAVVEGASPDPSQCAGVPVSSGGVSSSSARFTSIAYRIIS
jgi:hypothetical protein